MSDPAYPTCGDLFRGLSFSVLPENQDRCMNAWHLYGTGLISRERFESEIEFVLGRDRYNLFLTETKKATEKRCSN